jgi:hypothetical protein
MSSRGLGFEDSMKKLVDVPKEAIDRELEKIRKQAAEITAKGKKKQRPHKERAVR